MKGEIVNLTKFFDEIEMQYKYQITIVLDEAPNCTLGPGEVKIE